MIIDNEYQDFIVRGFEYFLLDSYKIDEADYIIIYELCFNMQKDGQTIEVSNSHMDVLGSGIDEKYPLKKTKIIQQFGSIDKMFLHYNNEEIKKISDNYKTYRNELQKRSSSDYLKNIIKYHEDIISRFIHWYNTNNFDPPKVIDELETSEIEMLNRQLSIANQKIKSQKEIVKALKLREGKPTKQELTELIEKYRFKSSRAANCSQIAKLLGKDSTTITRWIKKYGLSDYAFPNK